MSKSLTDSLKLFFTDKSISFDIIFFSTLLIIIPIALITGPALPDILLSLIALYFLIKSFLQKLWHYYQNPIVIGFLIFCGYSIFRSLFSEMPLESLTREGSVFYFRYIFFAMGVWYLLDKNTHLPKCLLLILLACATLVCIDGIYQYIFDVNFFGNPKFTSGRLTGLMGDEPIIGRYISYISIFTFALIYQNFYKSKKFLLSTSLFLLICLVMVFLSGERAPFIYLLFFIFFIFVFFPNFRIYNITGILLSIIIVFSLIQIKPEAKTRMIDYTIIQFNEINDKKLPILPFSNHHIEHLMSAYKMFLENPIFGNGTNTFSFYCEKPQYKVSITSCSSHPHNYYIQLLSELGLIGILFLLSFFIYWSYKLFMGFLVFHKKKRINSINGDFRIYVIVLFIYWWPLIPHMSFYNNWNNVMLMLPLGFFFKNYYGNRLHGNLY